MVENFKIVASLIYSSQETTTFRMTNALSASAVLPGKLGVISGKSGIFSL